MDKHKVLRSWSYAAFVLAAAAPAVAQQSETAAKGIQSDSGPATAVAEIVVTAQKRAENIQRVPVAVTAITPAQLKAVRFQNTSDLTALAPGLTARPEAGGATGALLTIRGVLGQATAGQDLGIALYLDGIYINNGIGSSFDIADIERIEVLRGPQGTLFGRNSLGGAVNVITHDPTGKFGVKQDFSVGNYDTFRSRTQVDLPQWGPLSATISYLHYQRRGDIRNLGAGAQWDYSQATDERLGTFTSPRYLGDQNVESIGAAIKLEASSNLEFLYKGHWNRNDFSAAQGIDALNSASATTPTVLAILGAQPNPSLLTPISRTRPDAINNAFATPSHLETQSHSLTATYRFSDDITLKDMVAYRKSHLLASGQLDGLGGLVNVFPPAPIGAPFLLIVSPSETRDSALSNELQLNVNTRQFTLTAGYLYFHAKTFAPDPPGLPSLYAFTTAPGGILPGVPTIPSRFNVTSNAVFVQNEIHLTNRLDLVLGSRLTWDRKTGEDNSIVGAPQPVDYRGSKPTWLAALNFHPTRDILTYAKFSTGYISGGEIGSLKFDPSTAKSYEFGAKADLFDRRLRTNVALYHVNYQGLQFLTTGLNFGLPSGSVVFNGGNARVNGVELESTFVPVRGLTLSGNTAYTDFKYTKVNPVLGTLSTFPPIFRPKWTGALSAQYETGEVVHGASLLFRFDAQYTSKEDTSTTVPFAYQVETRVPATWLFNARIGLSGLDVAGEKVNLALWTRNLANNRNLLAATDLSFLSSSQYQPARTFGLDVGFEF